MDQTSESPEFIPISRLNAFAYCRRRFYYEFIMAEMLVNEHVLAGTQLHERVDQPGNTDRGDKTQIRRVYLCAPVLGLAGYSDLVETIGDADDLATLAREGRLYPVEYKKGKMGRWLVDHVQLCAQALALEEVLRLEPETIRRGYLFYLGSARREEVEINPELRTKTLALLVEARQVAVQIEPPEPITNWRKCRDCSLEPMCLPREVLKLCSKTEGGIADGDTLPD